MIANRGRCVRLALVSLTYQRAGLARRESQCAQEREAESTPKRIESQVTQWRAGHKVLPPHGGDYLANLVHTLASKRADIGYHDAA